METDVLKYRARFPILESSTYLINNSLGAMPASTRDALNEYATLWATEGVVAWKTWMPMVGEVADLLGRIIGAPAGTVVMRDNVSSITAALISALEFTPERNRVVYSDLNFPTVHYNWKAAERRGAKVHLVESPDKMGVSTEAMIDAIDERTLAVPISHCLFRSSYLQDAKAIVARAHEVGALVILDAYQSVGNVPIDVVDLGVDFLIGGSVKWLCGGAGAAYLYARPEIAERLEPVSVGWFGHARPFDFEFGDMEYAEGAQRFGGGTPVVPSLYAAREGYRVVLEVGVDAIRDRSLALTRRLIEGALEQGLTVRTPQENERRGGTVVVDFDGAEACHHTLIERRIIVDYRPDGGIRISPHFYNTVDECDAVLEEISKIRSGS